MEFQKLSRRKFTGLASSLFGGIMIFPRLGWGNKGKGQIIGHNSHKYRVNAEWGNLDPSETPVKDCHEMVQDSKGRIILFNNDTDNNILIYDKSGKLLKTWGENYPGAHGLTLTRENDEDFLFLTDHDLHKVFKTTIDGRVLMTIDYPRETGKYDGPEQFKPTEVAVAPNGDFFIADGYGNQYITQYNYKGELIRYFGGKGDQPENFDNCHGICLDDRDPNNPILLITARQQNAFKRFSLDGKYLSTVDLPGAFICRPVIHGENLYFSVLISKLPWDSGTGFVTILDKNNKVISNPGGNTPRYSNGKLQQMHQVEKDIFIHPHDVCVDDDLNLYVAQWNSNRTYPIKLERTA